MRLVRYAYDEKEAIGVLEGETISELDVDGDGEIPPIVAAARGSADVETTGVEINTEDVTLRAPIERPGKIICLGLNYRDHAEEGGNEVPEEPLLFSKATSAVNDPNGPVVHPADIEQLDYEAEIAIIIGKAGHRIDATDAFDHVAGYTAFNDVTARDVQYGFSQYFRGKSFDTFAPMGPAMATADDFDPTDREIRALVNGDVRQESSTEQMIFDVPTTVESVSQTMTLYPGDVIATGTPPGVGVHRDPPLLLEPGDEVTIEVQGIGALQNQIVEES
ncbi:DUF2437 domain-containing protein [Natronorubrum sp. JWXQ-INN-674]|uniref:DUF2437 domain-containing protein n=1 Tax=Natronorubrum halalkaliphilum TaxID=2691917 RepID=A0A6B0VI92_9EURY|nr:fumarylacetoacetate hydrolase family protein [Natronorubrum halalkaliphilum]MXV60522.1 DUF2437 domain-containing protein [Natronorubrum halalkaliphilum]